MKKQKNGFTLIEVIIAVVLVSMIFVTIFKVFKDQLEFYKKSKDHAETSFALLQCLERARNLRDNAVLDFKPWESPFVNKKNSLLDDTMEVTITPQKTKTKTKTITESITVTCTKDDLSLSALLTPWNELNPTLPKPDNQ